MPNASTSAQPTPKSLVFAAYHRPTLTIGNYAIEVQQSFHTTDNSTIPPQTFTATRHFRVEGERFHLKPDDIQAVFPPKGSLGDHSNVLPHIVLTHSTLPWERSPDGSARLRPWLLLLVFSEAETPATKVISLGELANSASKFPHLSLSTHQKARACVSVIDVPRQVLEPLFPTLDDLAMLAHVRRLHFSDKDQKKMSRSDLDESERAVLIANRLPEPGTITTVHLVSVEGRYDAATGLFNFDHAGPHDEIRLVSLTSWRFTCITRAQTFANMVKGLERDRRSFRLPSHSNPDAETFLTEGFVPVRHALRQGGKTLSWYRGPFVTGAVSDNLSLPVHASDALLQYYPDVGMFNLGYASAWELGRLMALQSPTFASSLYEWKRLRDQQDKCNQRPEQGEHPLEKLTVETQMPESVKTGLAQLSYLQGIPFKYLVPDERLLPRESIRFFQVDVNWIRCLLDGAYSIGRIIKADFECDKRTPPSIPYTQATGILIRSDIVSGYPDVLIDGYDDQNNRLTELRRQSLSQNILLCLFEGNLFRLDIHQKPETLHFALELSGNRRYAKTLRDQQNISPNPKTITGELHEKRLVPISAMTSKMRDAFRLGSDDVFNSGHFALQMLETAEKVSFYRGPVVTV